MPARPSLEHLKNEAKQHLRTMRSSGAASAKLTDAQFVVARDYGFSGWRALKTHVEGIAADPLASFAGCYRHDPDIVSNSVLSVSCEGGRLRLQQTGGPKLTLSRQADGAFLIAGLPTRYVFDGGEDGPANAVTAHHVGGEVRMQRVDPSAAARAQAAFARAWTDQARPRIETPIRPALLDRYVGHYLSPFGLAFEIKRDGDRLFGQASGQQSVEVFPESETKFFCRVVAAQVSFNMEGGRAIGMVLHQNGHEQRLARVSAEAARQASARHERRAADQLRPRTVIPIDPAVLQAYVGQYRIDLQKVATVEAEGGLLFIEITGQRRYEVYPEGERDFFWTVVAAQISFVADEAGRTTHAVLHQAGHDLPLVRIEQEPRV